MSSYRVFKYAEPQARIRARLGMMPDIAQWRNVAEASDLDTLIGRMRENGLPYWVQGLPRAPSTSVIERHLQRRLLDFSRDLGKLLPDNWHDLRAVLETGGNLVFLHQMLSEEQPVLPDVLDSALIEIALLPAAQRKHAASASGYARYVDQSGPWQVWWRDLQHALPPLSRYESRKLHRVLSTITQHLEITHRTPAENSIELDTQWRWRNQLMLELGPLLCGDPFHPGLIAIYGALELLQFERCRALLICQSRGWRMPDVLAHAEAAQSRWQQL